MNDATAPTVTVRREIAAPAQELFDAWLDAKSLAIWLRPGGTLRTSAKVDPRVGGAFEIIMQTPSGPVPHTGTYKEIDRPRRLVFTWNSPYAKNYDSLVTVEFKPTRGVTEIVLTHEKLPSDQVEGHTKGWTGAIEVLAQTYGKQRSIA